MQLETFVAHAHAKISALSNCFWSVSLLDGKFWNSLPLVGSDSVRARLITEESVNDGV